MKVSVVIPVYNEERYIKNCLLSLTKQQVAPDEIIIVDNNCTDCTIRICKKFPVKIIKEKKQGMIHARNKGFNKACYQIIARCDADVVLPKDWIKKIKENFAQNNIDALGGPVIYYDLPLKTPFYSRTYLSLLRNIRKHHILIGPNMVLTKKIWKKVENHVCRDDSKVHEDIDLAIHINKQGGIIGYDKFLIVRVSARRIKHDPYSFFVEYIVRTFKTLKNHY